MKLVELPSELQAVLAGLIGSLVTEGLKALGNVFGVDLSGKAAVVTAAIVSALVFFANALLAKIPPEFEGAANAIFLLLVSLLGAFGVHRQLVRFGGRLYSQFD